MDQGSCCKRTKIRQACGSRRIWMADSSEEAGIFRKDCKRDEASGIQGMARHSCRGEDARNVLAVRVQWLQLRQEPRRRVHNLSRGVSPLFPVVPTITDEVVVPKLKLQCTTMLQR